MNSVACLNAHTLEGDIKDNFPIESNGKIDCYVVPLSFLDNITITPEKPDDYIPTIET